MIFKNLKETKKFLKKFTKDLKSELKKKKRVILLFQGHLGAGKTTFIKEIGNNLGIKAILKSPTFIIWQIYSFKINNEDYFFHHIDLYRIDAKDFLRLTFNKKIKEKNNIFAIEWGEKIEDYLKKRKIAFKKLCLKKFGKKRELTLYTFGNQK